MKSFWVLDSWLDKKSKLKMSRWAQGNELSSQFHKLK